MDLQIGIVAGNAEWHTIRGKYNCVDYKSFYEGSYDMNVKQRRS